MPSRLNSLLPASWNGVEFLVSSEVQAEGGRRIVLHDYPNSNTRYVEDMGEVPARFKVSAFVTGETFIDKSDKLERALKSPGRGELIIPTFGVLALYALPYTKDSSQKAVGEIKFTLEFVAGRATSGPSRTEPTLETVYVDVEEVMEAVEETVEDVYKPPTVTENVLAAIYDLSQCANVLNIITTTVNNTTDLESGIRLILLNAPKIVRSGDSLSTSLMSGLWKTVSVGLEEGKGLRTMLDLTKFGAELTLSLSDVYSAYVDANEFPGDYTIPLWPGTTASRLTRNLNRNVIANAERIGALTVAYQQASNKTYNTAVEIDETRADLETAHDRLMIDDTANPTLIQSDPRVRSAVETLRFDALNILEQKKQASFILTTIDNNAPASSFVLAYDLYAEELTTSEGVVDRGIIIRNLNPTDPADKLTGATTVLQA